MVGGTIATANGFRTHTFTASGASIFGSSDPSCSFPFIYDVLVVAGGGGGGKHPGEPHLV